VAAVVDSAVEVVDSTVAAAVAGTTKHQSSVTLNVNRSLLHAGCFFCVRT
jgi:hypothetical protein